MQPGNDQLEPAAGLFLLLFQEHPYEFPRIGFAALAPGVIAEVPVVSVVSQHIKPVVADKLPQPEAFGGYLHFGDRVTVIGIRWPVGVGSNRGDERIRPTVSVEGRVRKLQMLLHRIGSRRCEGPGPGWWW